jgi:hypothetical protein
MAREVSYKFKGKQKSMQFSYGQYHDIYEAAAANEGIDLTSFYAMEKQLAMSSRGQGIAKNYRQTEFLRMGFSAIHFVKQEKEES